MTVLGALGETLMMTPWDVTHILGFFLQYTACEGAGTGCRVTWAMAAKDHPWDGPE